MKVGITGQDGFIGQHLYNFLNLQESIELIPFRRGYFEQPQQLADFVGSCDTIVHLAALNRHENPQVIYDTNISLVQKLIQACQSAEVTPHILISSSTQEERDNLYGKSKKVGRELLEKWGTDTGAITTGMIIPNVFGAFGQPYYNSFVATFCHQVAATDEHPTIIQDATVQLIYVHELIDEIYKLMQSKTAGKVNIPYFHVIKVSELLDKLKIFKAEYIEKGVFPSIQNDFDLALFNTFRCYIPHSYYPRPFTKHTDNRGSFVEIVRANTSGQFSFSTTKPGITRGNHFHTRKAERFAVIKGKAKISLRKIDSDEVVDYIIDGENPAYVDMPIWHTHNISNIGDEEMIALFWINEPYNPEDADTYFVNV
ncbi:MAG: NAD-dependent epimerase/dehydratase family protein [Bacteroidota bacterium]